MPERPIRILLLEDTPSDVELALRELRRGGLDFVFEHVETLEAFEAAMEELVPDVVLADYHLQGFDGIDALRLSRQRPSPPPFLFVSGSIGEERAVEALREGATDYVMKDRLGRLPTAVLRAVELHERNLREQRSRELLRASEERFRLVALVTSEGVWDWNIGENQLLFSDVFRANFGYSDLPETVSFSWWSDRIHPDDAAAVLASIEVFLPSRERAWKAVYRFLHADGSWAIVEDQGCVVRDPEGRALRMIGAMRDITAERAAARAVEESEKRFRSVAESAKDAVVILDDSARVRFSNRSAREIFGRDEASLDGQPFERLIAPDGTDGGEWSAVEFLKAHSRRSGTEVSLTARGPAGRILPLEISISEWTLDGETFFTVVARDVSERRRQQMRQQAIAGISRDMLNAPLHDLPAHVSAALERVRALMDGTRACVLLLSDDLQSVEDVFESSAEGRARSRGGQWTPSVAPYAALLEAAQGARPPILRLEDFPAGAPERRLFESAGAKSALCTPIEREGNLIGIIGISAADAARVWDDDDHALLRVIGEVIVNAVARKRAFDDLTRSESMLAEAQMLATLGSWEQDLGTGAIRWSEEMVRLHGLEPGSFKPGRESILELIHPEDRETVSTTWDSGKDAASAVSFDYRIVRPDENVRILHARQTRVTDATGRVVRLRGIAQDVTERVLLERQVEQTKRIASLGHVAATMAHEFNNVLMGIQPCAEIIDRRLSADDPRAQKAARSILNSVQRGRHVTQDILRFSRPGTPAFTTIDVNDWLSTLAAELRPSLGERIRLVVNRAPVALAVRGDPQQLAQIVSNLVFNARDAMPSGGTITISMHPPVANEVRSFGIVEDAARRVHIVVADEGEGIPPHVLPNIFDPLFTTKRTGTGIGLAVVHQIVQGHGGQIFVESHRGQGTAFHIFLPAPGESLSSEAEPARSESRAQSS